MTPETQTILDQVRALRDVLRRDGQDIPGPEGGAYLNCADALDTILQSPGAGEGCINCHTALPDPHRQHWYPCAEDRRVGPLCDTCYDLTVATNIEATDPLPSPPDSEEGKA